VRQSVLVGGVIASRALFVPWFLARPDDPARILGRPPSARWRAAARAVAVREALLVAGAVVALRRGRPASPWLRAFAGADTLDGTLIALAGFHATTAPRRVALSAGSAVAGALTELALSRDLGRAASEGQQRR
jgi:hypothetical protein